MSVPSVERGCAEWVHNAQAVGYGSSGVVSATCEAGQCKVTCMEVRRAYSPVYTPQGEPSAATNAKTLPGLGGARSLLQAG